MGAKTSRLFRISNDFELIARAAKELDRVLAEGYGLAPIQRLGDKIDVLEETKLIHPKTIGHMRRLVELRNQLMHNFEYNSLKDINADDRNELRQMYSESKAELMYKMERLQQFRQGNWGVQRAATVVGTTTNMGTASVEDQHGSPRGRNRCCCRAKSETKSLEAGVERSNSTAMQANVPGLPVQMEASEYWQLSWEQVSF